MGAVATLQADTPAVGVPTEDIEGIVDAELIEAIVCLLDFAACLRPSLEQCSVTAPRIARLRSRADTRRARAQTPQFSKPCLGTRHCTRPRKRRARQRHPSATFTITLRTR